MSHNKEVVDIGPKKPTIIFWAKDVKFAVKFQEKFIQFCILKYDIYQNLLVLIWPFWQFQGSRMFALFPGTRV